MFIYTKSHSIDVDMAKYFSIQGERGRRIVNLLLLSQIVIIENSSAQTQISMFYVQGNAGALLAIKPTLEEAQAVMDRIFKAITEGKTFLDLQNEEAPETKQDA